MAATAESLNAPTSIRFVEGVTINPITPPARALSQGEVRPNIDEDESAIQRAAAEANRDLDSSLPTRRLAGRGGTLLSSVT